MADTVNIFSVKLASTQNIIQINHTGYTITSTDGSFANLTVDNVLVQIGNWILLTSQIDKAENGLWYVNQVGNGTDTHWQLIRLKPAGDLINNQLFYTSSGNTNIGKIWRLTNPDPITAGSTLIEFEVIKTKVEASNQICADNSTDPATPGYAFIGDKNSGMGYAGDNSEALITGGARALTIDSSQNININTGNLLMDDSTAQILANGTLSLLMEPTYSFSSDINTGIKHIDTDSVALMCNGGVSSLNLSALKITNNQRIMTRQYAPATPGSGTPEIITMSQILTGILIGNFGVNVDWQLDTAANLLIDLNQVCRTELFDSIDFSVINLGTGNITLLNPAGGNANIEPIVEPPTSSTNLSEGIFRMQVSNFSIIRLFRIN